MPPTIESQHDVSSSQLLNIHNPFTVSHLSHQHNAPPAHIGSAYIPQSTTNPHLHVSNLDRLRELPTIRPIPWRAGQELPPERAGNSGRTQCRGAILLVTRGQVMENPCSNCKAGHGRFSVCVTLDNWFQGSCSSCTFTSKGNKCSLRVKKEGDEEAPESPGDAKPAKKRKRKSTPAAIIQYDGTQNPVPPQALSPDLDSMLQAQIAEESFTRPQSLEGKLPQANVGRGRGSFVFPSHPAPYQTPYQNFHSSEAQKTITNTPNLQDELRFPAKGPWTVLQNQQQQSTPLGYSSQLQRPSTMQSASTLVIDLIPKVKQREMYTYISGIQGGIDHLQKQLDALKHTLGIDDDD